MTDDNEDFSFDNLSMMINNDFNNISIVNGYINDNKVDHFTIEKLVFGGFPINNRVAIERIFLNCQDFYDEKQQAIDFLTEFVFKCFENMIPIEYLVKIYKTVCLSTSGKEKINSFLQKDIQFNNWHKEIVEKISEEDKETSSSFNTGISF